jgi:hypothetical protein
MPDSSAYWRHRFTRAAGASLNPLTFWMQTTGAALLATERRTIACLQTPAQDSRSAHGLLYALLYGTTDASRNTIKRWLTVRYLPVSDVVSR